MVEDQIILFSQLKSQYAYLRKTGISDMGTLECDILEEFLTQKILIAKAQYDSIKVTDDQVDREVERRIELFAQKAGGIEQLEKIYQKPLPLLKRDLRDEVREQLLAEEMRQKIFSGVKVSPREVREFYEKIDPDSLPYIPAEVEVCEIVIFPEPSPQAKQQTRQKLQELRKEILSGTMEFASAARTFSEDLASARVGGYLGEFTRGQMVPAFEAAAFSTPIGEISPLFETPYGYHIVKVHKRLGNRVEASHILLRPPITETDERQALSKLQDLKKRIENQELAFTQAALKYSQDPLTKNTGGLLQDPETGEYRIPLDKLDAEIYFQIDRLKEGQLSEPHLYIRPDGRQAARLLWLKKRYPPHKANLQLDYARFEKAALQLKNQTVLENWLKKARSQIFIEVYYEPCREALSNWINP